MNCIHDGILRQHLDGELAGILIDHGWDRYSRDEGELLKFLWKPSIGPKIGFDITDSMSLEGTVQFGEYIYAGLQIVYRD